MTLCLSFFDAFDAEVLTNHAHYCRMYDYSHRWVDASGTAPAVELRQFRKYSEILRALRALAPQELLLFLDGDSLVCHPVAIERLMDGRDLLATAGPPVGEQPGGAMANMLGLRNTAPVRQMLHELISDASRVIASRLTVREDPGLDASQRLQPLGMLPCNAMALDRHVNVSWRFPGWWAAPIFVVSLAPIPVAGPAGTQVVDPLHDIHLQRLLARQINAFLQHGTPIMQSPAYPPLGTDAMTSHQPGRAVALLTLYTDNISGYARVSEHNVKRYCERRGYTYHVYRAIPEAIEPGINGAWIKSWLLMQHLQSHEWVIWVDADVIFRNPSRPLEPLLAGRDLLFTKDLGQWAVNSGVMAFRNTPRNQALLAQLWQRISEVQDKSAVYSSNGDQAVVNDVLREHGLVDEAVVLDNLELNTPPLLAGPDTLMVHFMGLGEPYRGVYMADMDRQSQRW